ncbi:uncharacterized protein At1g76070-like [Andrographis paniculata]|uniref:uncharacterized protein At1g76070-like n=1 Tax=Andrographis paniculata TaxID=175694 RepID=UPI0021E9572F|nr:uncharacterized protein At1g76070-like [Andrographis paniculata]
MRRLFRRLVLFMEKTAAKAKKTSILKILPKAAQAAAISFQNLPFSPRRDKRTDGNAHKHKYHFSKGGFSGPIMIPAEARGRWRNSGTPEPSSPKVSCIGQIKYRRNLSRKKHDSRSRETVKSGKSKKIKAAPARKPSGIMKIFSSGRKSDAAIEHMRPPAVDSPPRLGQLRKFASSRDGTLANFDWSAAQIAPEENHDREFYSDGEKEFSDWEDDVIIPFSAPILRSGAGPGVGVGAGAGAGLDLEPRKEINLWKRRTMACPKRLQLNN